MDRDACIEALRKVMAAVGLDVTDPSVKDTPRRVYEVWNSFGAIKDADEAAKKFLSVTFEAEYDQAVALANIEFTSWCEHHLLPFTGKAGVAYIPQEKVVGLSKLARVVDAYAAAPQLQERMTEQIADALWTLNPKGVMVLVEATHSCMACRGPKKKGAVMRTSSLRGVLKKDGKARAEVLKLLL